MIEPRPVVFVLGAGASKPYGFPTGEELKDRMSILLAVNPDQHKGVSRFSDPVYSGIATVSALKAAGFNRNQIDVFAGQLRQSLRLSIDAFLECQPGFAEIGKAAILSVLLPCEAKTHGRDGAAVKVEGDWYRLLYNSLFQRREDVGRLRTGFINFNYDRSFDECLIRALKIDFGFTREEVLAAIPIRHPYGTLGTEYGASLEGLDIKAAAKAIHVIGEQDVTEDEAFRQARDLILEAETICFLGFGYHEENIRRLKISKEWPKALWGGVMEHDKERPLPPKNVVGTTLGLLPPDVARISRCFNVPVEFQLFGVDVLMFLRGTDILDRARRQTAEA